MEQMNTTMFFDNPCSYPAQVHEIPAVTIDDSTWGNDAAPSFTVTPFGHPSPTVQVWYLEDDPDLREDPSEPKYAVAILDEDGQQEEFGREFNSDAALISYLAALGSVQVLGQ